MDWQILAAVWPIVAGGAAVVIGIIVWAIRGEARSRNNEMVAAEARRVAMANASDLADFRERVAQEYVTTQTMISIRVEITEALNRLGDRLDRLLEHRG